MTPRGIGGIVSCRLADVAFSTRSNVDSADAIEAAAVHCAERREFARELRRALRVAVRDLDVLRIGRQQRAEHAASRAAGAEQQHARAGEIERRDCASGRRPARRHRCCRRAAPSLRSTSVFTAPAISARGVRSRAIRHAACLCGTVTFNPLPPAAKNSTTSSLKFFGRDFQA